MKHCRMLASVLAELPMVQAAAMVAEHHREMRIRGWDAVLGMRYEP